MHDAGLAYGDPSYAEILVPETGAVSVHSECKFWGTVVAAVESVTRPAVTAAFDLADAEELLGRHAIDAMKTAGVEVVELDTGGEDAFHAGARALYESLRFLKVPIAGYVQKL